MSAVQTMEAVNTPVSTLMALMSVSVGVATDCPVMEETALVCWLGFEVVYIYTQLLFLYNFRYQ